MHAINTAIRAIQKQLPDAADYLKNHIRTGSTFLYTGEMTWAT